MARWINIRFFVSDELLDAVEDHVGVCSERKVRSLIAGLLETWAAELISDSQANVASDES